MKVDFRKGWIGYVFFAIIALGCIAVGFVSLDENVWAAVFAFVLGLALLLLALRRAATPG